ncbi:MAG: glycine--tRNA ligase, partial [Thermoplasmata archaeon]|nr:glycine--tRNA ligase [Thermoplasmata archaeon]NIS13345.1 glycine--tRNA ligase [Thermoplasmata archaeon]NIS21235.1 glycine--tRNA ligase [Thermoplasmata archaeon]NIT78734.1 glycine--tRNA ligase [Thermoplasmata archaeon]NIU50288.1 glycine--tRNA ligase [Thermoplasmata archaeon]
AKRRGFLWPSFELYGGMRGFYDYGPMGAALKRNIERFWLRLWVGEEGMIELDSALVNPREVFEASGHLEEFEDFVVSCADCDSSFRADHLLEGLHPNPDALSKEELAEELVVKGVTCPECGGGISEPASFNLMFATRAGPGEGREAYLRPETAQGIFVNFSHLYRLGRERLPFGVAQLGRGFRNEISPRQGIIRLREFNMAEVEAFFHPAKRQWSGDMRTYADTQLTLVPDGSDEVQVTLGEALEKGIMCNEALAYFVGVTQRFLVGVGVDPERLRFRQHLQTEMAHYASDCWDAEALLSYGWTELVGIADRGDFDLRRHHERSGQDLRVFVRYPEPQEMEVERLAPVHKELGPRFRGDAKAVAEALMEADASAVGDDGTATVTIPDGDGTRSVEVPAECFTLERKVEKVTGERVLPHVVEPSFGIDRITWTVLEHAYTQRTGEDGEAMTVLQLPPIVAPVNVGVFPLVTKDGLDIIAEQVDGRLRGAGLRTHYDGSGSIGRRYARADEAGIPFCITVDHQSREDDSVTIRWRDTQDQVRLPISHLVDSVKELSGLD